MSDLFDQLNELLEDSDYDFQVADSDEVLRLAFETAEGQWMTYVRVMASGPCVLYGKPEFDVPAEHRQTVSDFITRVNFGILVGNFELDFVDGECRFKTAFDSDHGRVPAAIFVNAVEGNLANMQKYLPSIAGIATGAMTLDEALIACGRPNGAIAE
jgi:hypothetical protein